MDLHILFKTMIIVILLRVIVIHMWIENMKKEINFWSVTFDVFLINLFLYLAEKQ
jgi:hypothetical protein